MVDYPRRLELEPIGEWPGELSTRREPSLFKATIGVTMGDLQTELDALGGTNPRLGIAVTREQLRLDGRLRAGERPYHPGVILMFTTKRHGEMRYTNDRFLRWEHNLRGIVKELEALRGITRWVNNGGQQYGGFRALESAIAVPASPFTDADGARHWLEQLLSYSDHGIVPALRLVREAQRKTHPDRGGDADLFRLVTAAEVILRKAEQL